MPCLLYFFAHAQTFDCGVGGDNADKIMYNMTSYKYLVASSKINIFGF